MIPMSQMHRDPVRCPTCRMFSFEMTPERAKAAEYAQAAPIQIFGCWLKSWEEPDRWARFPSYWVGGRCAAGCHMIEYQINHEFMDDPGYLEHLACDAVQRIALAHAGLGGTP